LTLPLNPSANVNARTHNGDIVTDFGLPVSGDESKSLSGKIGSGTARVVLSAENGDVRIKKGSGFPPEPPPTPAVPANHKTPGTPQAPHLKAPKVRPAPPVTQ
jgi:hypothetical protein